MNKTIKCRLYTRQDSILLYSNHIPKSRNPARPQTSPLQKLMCAARVPEIKTIHTHFHYRARCLGKHEILYNYYLLVITTPRGVGNRRGNSVSVTPINRVLQCISFGKVRANSRNYS